MEERPLWSPEAISWYRSRDNSYPPVAADMHMHKVFTGTKQQKDVITYTYRDSKGKISYTHRLRGIDRIRGRIDIDIFNIAIELKIFKSQLSIRDLLAECLRDRIVADDFVIGVLIGFPTKEELDMDPTMSENEREYLGRIIKENLYYHKYMFEQAKIQLVTVGL
jgi:hypothetical protein